jgi:hypothetical protein
MPQIFTLAQTWHTRISYKSQALSLIVKQAYVHAMSRQGGQIHADKNFYFLIQKICVNLPAIRQAGLRPKWDFLYYQVLSFKFEFQAARSAG